MADDADRAALDSDVYEEALRSKFTGEPYKIDPGVAGECGECGEYFARIVKGCCARCRDKLGRA